MMGAGSKDLWNVKAIGYDAIRRMPILRQTYETELRRLQALIPPRPFASHLDVGTGTGSSLKIFEPAPLQIITDRSLAMLRIAVRRTGLPGVVLDLDRRLPFRDHSFELITAIGVMEYVRNLCQVLRELLRIASADGFLLFTTSPPGWFATLRKLTGTPPQVRAAARVRRDIRDAGWLEVAHHHCHSQDQWLCRNPAEESREP